MARQKKSFSRRYDCYSFAVDTYAETWPQYRPVVQVGAKTSPTYMCRWAADTVYGTPSIPPGLTTYRRTGFGAPSLTKRRRVLKLQKSAANHNENGSQPAEMALKGLSPR